MTTLFETEIIASFISVAFRGKRAAALAVSERLFRLRAGESGNMTKPFRHIGAEFYVCTSDEAVAYYGRRCLCRSVILERSSMYAQVMMRLLTMIARK